MSRRDMDDYLASVTGGQAQQHCEATAQPIGDGRWECPADGSVFGIDYESGDVGWKETK